MEQSFTSREGNFAERSRTPETGESPDPLDFNGAAPQTRTVPPRPPKPQALPFIGLPEIPAMAELQAHDAWVAWDYVWKEDKEKWDKPPFNPHTGRLASTADPSTWGTYKQAAARVERDKLAGVGFVLTKDGPFTGIDLDDCRDPETGELQPWAQVAIDFGETYGEASPSGGGLRLFVRGKVDGRKTDAAQVEIYTDGRYLTVTGQHLPGTPTEICEAPRTVAYLQERADQFRAAQHVAAEKAREAERKKAEKVAAAGTTRERASGSARAQHAPQQPGGNGFFRAVNERALANLGTWVRNLFPNAKLQPGTQAWRVCSRDLGRDLEEDLSIAPNGIKDWGVADMGDPRDGGRTPIDLVIEHGGASAPCEAALWLCERLGIAPGSLGWRDGRLDRNALHSSDPFARAVEQDKDGTIRDASTGEDLTPGSAGPGDVLDSLSLGQDADWTQPAGLLGEMAEWILASSRWPNRPLAVAAATAVLSGVCGRWLYGPTGTALNLYLVMLADTAVGKGRPLSAVGEILRAAGLSILYTTAKAFSASSLEQMMIDHPCCVATSDEIGASLLGRMSSKNSHTNETAMRGVLLELWSREQGQGPFHPTRRATADKKLKQIPEIPWPSLTLFGASTSSAFYGAVTGGSVQDGFLNRFLLVEAAARSRAEEPPQSARIVPERIATALLDIIPEGEGNLQTKLGNFDILVEPVQIRLPWANDEVKRRALDFEEEILKLADGNKECAPLMGRIFEYSVRLASLHAVSRDGREGKVGLADLGWGAAWAVSSAKAMTNETAKKMASSDYELKLNAVRHTIETAGIITQRDLLRRNRSVSAFDRDQIVRHLEGGGFIEAINMPTSGRPAQGWRWIG